MLPSTCRRLLLTTAMLIPAVISSSSSAALIFKDDFSAYGTNSSDLNLNLPATDGAALPTTKIRQSGTVGAWRYTEQGNDNNSQIGNPATDAGQAGGKSYADYMLLAYTCQATSDLPINEAMAQGQPLSISFDLGAALPPAGGDPTWWFAFRLGAKGSAYPVVGSDSAFAFLYRINKAVQVFTTASSGVEFTGMTSNHFTMVFTDSSGFGSAFNGNGTKVSLYNGERLIGSFETAQLTEAFMNFSVQNAFASVDNLAVESGLPAFLADAFRITSSNFDFGSSKAALTWTSNAGRTYQITHSPTLAGPWTNVGAQVDATGDTSSTTVDIDPAQGRDFYRAEVVVPSPLVFDGQQVQQDALNKKLLLSDSTGNLQLRLSYAGRALLDRVQVNGNETINPLTGACTGIQVGGNWVTTRTLTHDPDVTINGNDVTLSNIEYSSGSVSVRETWLFHTSANGIDWTITRNYLTGGSVDDSYFPGWDFASSSTWTAGLLDTGGVAWSRFIGAGNSYGTHSGTAKFWKDGNGLNIIATPMGGATLASRFSHQPSGVMTFAQSVNSQPLATKHLLYRSISGMDVWAPFTATASSSLQTKLTLQSVDANAQRKRGTFPGVDGQAVQDVLDTIGRYGVIDRKLMGGNGWLSGYICLHEPFFAEMGLALNNPDYTANLATSLDGWRDYALQPNGRVYSRWHHDSGDNVSPGTYNATTGYYDCGWGVLLDSQTCYAINVSEQFDLTADLTWLQGQKEPCERALNWLLARDSDNDGLVEAVTDYHTQNKSSDWIDIVWASHENALINAQLYYALGLWAEREELLGDSTHAATYRAAAAKLKAAYVKPLAEGGFWDPDKGWFAYWRDKDNSIHGDNLVTPVNFCAIAYGLASNEQAQQILSTTETKMRAENLFHWPLCFLPYAADEGNSGAFPAYENGDIFLSWGEVALRAYSAYDPSIAVAYVNRLLTQYKKDGLSYQRYLRASQTGAGDDILAGNSMTIVGLMRDIYGIRPQWNRLMLDPHITAELAGTQLDYNLRGQSYQITPGTTTSTVVVDGVTTTSPTPFAVNAAQALVTWYAGLENKPAMTIARDTSTVLQLTVQSWPSGDGLRQWSETTASASASAHQINGLVAGKAYTLKTDGAVTGTLTADTNGSVTFNVPVTAAARSFSLEPAAN